MYRNAVRRATLIILGLGLLATTVVFASPYSDFMKAANAFMAAKSWYAVEHFSNGRTVTIEYVARDRWRIKPSPKVTELLIGSSIYMVRNGKSTRLPFGGGMVRKMIEKSRLQANGDIEQSIRDLGMTTVDGKSVHGYSYTANSIPVTVYVGADSLPVQTVEQDKKVTITIDYSNFNAPISIQP
jgi:hypothetical protein